MIYKAEGEAYPDEGSRFKQICGSRWNDKIQIGVIVDVISPDEFRKDNNVAGALEYTFFMRASDGGRPSKWSHSVHSFWKEFCCQKHFA